MKLTTTLIAAVLAVNTAQVQTPAALMYDAKIGPIAFGAGDKAVVLEGFNVALWDQVAGRGPLE